MGITAENVADQYKISREDQDAFGLASQQKAERAIREGRFKEKIVPIVIPQKKGDPVLFDTDEHPRFGTTLEALAKLPTVFKKDGTVTAGTSSGINDGAGALVIMERGKAEALGLKSMGVIRAAAAAGVDPNIMGIGPVPATRIALKRAGITVDDLDVIEMNEAFAAQALACVRELGLNIDESLYCLASHIQENVCSQNQERSLIMRTREQYIQGLSKMNRNLYSNGEKIDRLDERQQGAINVMGLTFDAVWDPESRDLCTALSHLTGETINRFNHIHQNSGDLHKKQDMTRFLCNKVGQCIQRCMGIDAANAVHAISFESQKLPGAKTAYYENWLKWLERFQSEDLVGCCAQTDVKGERLKRPGQQTDLDMYLRVVEERTDGIVVRGSKVHISEASIADEILVVPTRALTPGEGAYAISFAVPADHEGVKQVVHFHNPRKREHFQRGIEYGYTDSYIIFDDCFVPWDRVFLCGETQHGGVAALLFALFHRHSYSGCKPAMLDYVIGLAAMAAEINGIEKTPHVREMLSELIMTGELGYAAGYTASALGKNEVYFPGAGFVTYGPGSCIPHSIYANVGRCLSGEAVFHEQEILCNIAGGLPATFPYEKDLTNPETKALLEKYLRRNPEIPIQEQIKFWLSFVDFALSSASGSMLYGAYHGGGSPIMEQIAITSQYDIESKKEIVRKIAGMLPKSSK